MPYTERFSEVNNVLATHYPLARQTAKHVSAWVKMSSYHRGFFLLMLGAMGASATVDAGLEQASDGAGTGAKAITGKVITQLTQAGSDDNSLAGIELRTEELDVNNGFEWVRFYVTPGTADVTYSAVLLGTIPRFAAVGTTAFDEVVD